MAGKSWRNSRKSRKSRKNKLNNLDRERERNANRRKVTEILDQVSFIQPFGKIKNEVYGRVFDCCCLLVHCQTHNKCLVSKTDEFIWLPYIIIPEKACWTEMARQSILMILSNNDPIKYEHFKQNLPYNYVQLIDVSRIQTSRIHRFFLRITYYVGVEAQVEDQTTNNEKSSVKSDNFECCNDIKNLLWLDFNMIYRGAIRNLWGPELIKFCALIKNSQAMSAIPQSNIDLSTESTMITKSAVLPESAILSETANNKETENNNAETSSHSVTDNKENIETLSIVQKIEEFGFEQMFHFLPKNNKPTNTEEETLRSIKITENDIERLFNDFTEHCYPSSFMTFYSFRQYMLKNGFDSIDFNMKRLFNAFNYQLNGFLSFHEVLLGFVCLERETPHNEIRVKFIFRYYDTKRRGALFYNDMKKLVSDMYKCYSQRSSNEEISKKTDEAMIKFEAETSRNRLIVPYNKFFETIARRQFSGTSILCRSLKRSIFYMINKRLTTRNVRHAKKKKTPFHLIIKPKYIEETCHNCLKNKYHLVPFVLLINQTGYNFDIEKISIQQTNAKSFFDDSVVQRFFYLQFQHTAHVLIEKIRQFSRLKERGLGFMTSRNEPEEFYLMIKELHRQLVPLLKSESRVCTLWSPCFIIGDIHGNLDDLMSLEKTIWRRFTCTGVSFLFLGDYVDRGKWSIECTIYLLSLKVLMPQSIILLRGNHETRMMQEKYTFKKECFDKYEDFGELIWEMTNQIFDLLPICAIVDDCLYCAHGGIPQTSINLNDLEKEVSRNFNYADCDAPISWEILWSDPINMELYKKMIQSLDVKQLFLKEGYIVNNRRGTAYYFNEIALKNFFLKNKLTHLIRAHEVVMEGFFLHFEGKCATIFSCSHYCGNDNKCCVLFSDQQKLRFIRIDTANNQIATDGF